MTDLPWKWTDVSGAKIAVLHGCPDGHAITLVNTPSQDDGIHLTLDAAADLLRAVATATGQPELIVLDPDQAAAVRHLAQVAQSVDATTNDTSDAITALPAALRPPHPEDHCHRCGGPNVTWHAPNDLWNQVMPDDGIVCPLCFIKAAADAGISTPSWRLGPSGHAEPIVIERVSAGPDDETSTALGDVGLDHNGRVYVGKDGARASGLTPAAVRWAVAVLATYADLADLAEQQATPERVTEEVAVEALTKAISTALWRGGKFEYQNRNDRGAAQAAWDANWRPAAAKIQASIRRGVAQAEAGQGERLDWPTADDEVEEIAADDAHVAAIETRRNVERIERAIGEACEAEDFATLEPPNIYAIAVGLAKVIKPEAFRTEGA